MSVEWTLFIPNNTKIWCKWLDSTVTLTAYFPLKSLSVSPFSSHIWSPKHSQLQRVVDFGKKTIFAHLCLSSASSLLASHVSLPVHCYHGLLSIYYHCCSFSSRGMEWCQGLAPHPPCMRSSAVYGKCGLFLIHATKTTRTTFLERLKCAACVSCIDQL